MDANKQVDALLAESGAKLKRQGKHLVYELPHGKTFTRTKTPSDHRTAQNQLSELKKVLGIQKEKEQHVMAAPQRVEPIVEPPAPEPLPLPPPPPPTLRQKIDQEILDQTAEQDRLVALAGAVDARLKLLRSLVEYADDPTTEVVLRAVLPKPPEPPKPTLVEAPPPPVIERTQVTRQLVYLATQTFEDAFTINDVLERMTNGKKLDSVERNRVRTSITGALIGLLDRGDVIKESAPGRLNGTKQQSLWRKVNPHGQTS